MTILLQHLSFLYTRNSTFHLSKFFFPHKPLLINNQLVWSECILYMGHTGILGVGGVKEQTVLG